MGMNLDLQIEMFAVALEELESDGDLVNQVLEIGLRERDEEISVLRYALPGS